MERKIGEVFKYNGEWYQCMKAYDKCSHCDFEVNYYTCRVKAPWCSGPYRKDRKYVIFKKLKKVGEPFFSNIQGNIVLQQRYKKYEPMVTLEGYWYRIDVNFINIEIKQNKDMETNNPNLSNSENIGKNLKPFDLAEAKLGKPVCTRDGRKARIICFDVKGDICPIIALVEENGMEVTKSYDENGRANYKNADNYDLMMLPEKKEGWVNLYRDEESKRVYCGEFIFL